MCHENKLIIPKFTNTLYDYVYQNVNENYEEINICNVNYRVVIGCLWNLVEMCSICEHFNTKGCIFFETFMSYFYHKNMWSCQLADFLPHFYILLQFL
jgi:hypothetical protein